MQSESATPTRANSPQHRFVVLGASNVARSLPTVISAARHVTGGPVEFIAAIGHGRSYGKNSWVLGRKISGILPSRIWDELARRPALPTTALLTDIGNDILYGSSINCIVTWVKACLDHLATVGARTTVTLLPIANLKRLGVARFMLFRTLLFPQSHLTLAAATSRAHELNDRLVELARTTKTSTFAGRNDWYGFDPIHVRWTSARAAWHEIVSSAHGTQSAQPKQSFSVWQSAYVRALAPWERSVWGVTRRREQPSGRLPDGTTVSLF